MQRRSELNVCEESTVAVCYCVQHTLPSTAANEDTTTNRPILYIPVANLRDSFRNRVVRHWKMSSAIDVYIALLSVWVCGSVAANISLIICIWKSKKSTGSGTKSSVTSTDVLIISLAVNDILMAGIVLPQMIHELSHTEHVFECKYTFFTNL